MYSEKTTEFEEIFVAFWENFTTTASIKLLSFQTAFYFVKNYSKSFNISKVYVFWEGHKILQNLHLTFFWHYIG